jgi:hypothetical protein
MRKFEVLLHCRTDRGDNIICGTIAYDMQRRGVFIHAKLPYMHVVYIDDTR